MDSEGVTVQHSAIRFDQRLQRPALSGAATRPLALLALLAALPFQAAAQQAAAQQNAAQADAAQEAAGGLRLTFGIALRAETDSNADLDPVSPGQTSRAIADLGFGLTSETRSSRLELNAGVSVQTETGGAVANNGVVNPFVTLSYGRESANAAFSFDAALRESDLTTQDDVTDFDATTGTRRLARLDAGLQWGINRPLGFGVTAGLTDTTYQDAPGEADNRSTRLGATARLDLSEVTTLTLGLRGQRFDEEGAPDVRDTLGFDAGVDIARPRGTLGLDLSVEDTEDGQRETLRFRNSLDLPRGTLAYSFGAAIGVDDETRLIGSLDYRLDLPRGSLTAALARSLQAGSDDLETAVTRASLGYQQELTPLSRFSLSLNWAESTDTGTGTDLGTTNASIGATYRHELTEDWALDLGYTHRLRDEDGVGEASSDRVFLGLRREFLALK